MSPKNDTLSLTLALISTVVVLATGFLWLKKNTNSQIGIFTDTNNSNIPGSTNKNSQLNSNPASTPSSASATFSAPHIVPQGIAIEINGSTSLVQTNQALKKSFQRQFPGTVVITNAEGSETGITMLQAGDIDLAAISRPLSTAEQAQGLRAVPIVQDTISVFVSFNNPFRRGLTSKQLVDIFQGNITNWSQLGGQDSIIRVINRPTISGTRQVFTAKVLQGETFGTSPNFITMERDATTPILRALGTDGISYATYAQVANQQTVRTVAIDGLTPEADSYPYQRVLYYVYQAPANLEVKAFLGYALSDQGQKAISDYYQ